MNLTEYQDAAMTFRLPSANADYALLNLAGEVGELMSLEAKMIRDGAKWDDFRSSVKKEMGDILWCLAAVAYDNGFTLEQVAQGNLEKLQSRQQRGVLTGSGNDR